MVRLFRFMSLGRMLGVWFRGMQVLRIRIGIVMVGCVWCWEVGGRSCVVGWSIFVKDWDRVVSSRNLDFFVCLFIILTYGVCGGSWFDSGTPIVFLLVCVS